MMFIVRGSFPLSMSDRVTGRIQGNEEDEEGEEEEEEEDDKSISSFADSDDGGFPHRLESSAIQACRASILTVSSTSAHVVKNATALWAP